MDKSIPHNSVNLETYETVTIKPKPDSNFSFGIINISAFGEHFGFYESGEDIASLLAERTSWYDSI